MNTANTAINPRENTLEQSDMQSKSDDENKKKNSKDSDEEKELMAQEMNDNPIKVAFSYTKKAFIYGGIFSFGMNILMLFLPLYSMQVLDRVISSRNMNTLVFLSLICFAAFVFYGVLNAVRSSLMVRVGNWLDAKLSPFLLQISVVGSAQNHPLGKVQNLRDLATIKNFIMGTGITALFEAPFVPAYIMILFLIHPSAGMIALVGGIILLLLALINELMTRKILDRANEKQIANFNAASSFVTNSEAIEAMGMMKTLNSRWAVGNNEVLALQNQASNRSNIIMSISRSIRMILQVMVIGVGGYFALHDQMTVGAMIAGSILVGRALAPFEQAIGVWKPFTATRESYARLKKTTNEIQSRSEHMELPPPKGDLKVENLYYRPAGSDKPILRGLNFELFSGETLGLIGPSAAGKSTLGKLIVGIWKPLAGNVRLDGADVYQWQREDFGQHVGYLPQNCDLFPGTIRDNIARMAADASPDSITKAAMLAGVHEMVLQMPKGYDTVVGEGGIGLSPGQRQRIGLARAFYGNPKVIVLDEPNSNLDSNGEMALLNAVKSAKSLGITMVIIAHKPSILRSVDKIMMIREGAIESFGPRDEVMAKYTRK